MAPRIGRSDQPLRRDFHLGAGKCYPSVRSLPSHWRCRQNNRIMPTKNRVLAILIRWWSKSVKANFRNTGSPTS